METGNYLKEIIGYKEIYGNDETLDEASQLIGRIPTASLLYKIAHINIYLYLSHPGSGGQLLQVEILNSFLKFCPPALIAKFKAVIKKVETEGNWPTIFWEHSNLLFYDLVFKNQTPGIVGHLSDTQTEQILKAYLIVNSITNNRFSITKEEVDEAAAKGELESILIPHFIYQRDYISNLDFSNQINRAILFFDYLENTPEYQPYIADYYTALHIKSYKELLYNILSIWTQAEIDGPVGNRRAQISFSTLKNLVNLDYIESLAINKELSGYQSDLSFTALREHPLYKIGPTEYIILDINFLTDQLYKAQVFAFKKFIKSKGYQGNFLSVKGKDFMEDIYLRSIMKRCFPQFVKLNGDQATKNDNTELCDYYVRDQSKVLLMEFKDILLNADIKATANKTAIDKELHKKFSANQKNSAKGITQLYNAVKYLENSDLINDITDRNTPLDIYPVIVYTDQSFGHEGINKMFNKSFQMLLAGHTFQNVKVNGVTFINLNYFEVHEAYLSSGTINLYELIKKYQEYVSEQNQSTTTFEVFSRAYFRENNVVDIKENKLLKENMAIIMPEATL